jgi:hypothetical protein
MQVEWNGHQVIDEVHERRSNCMSVRRGLEDSPGERALSALSAEPVHHYSSNHFGAIPLSIRANASMYVSEVGSA